MELSSQALSWLVLVAALVGLGGLVAGALALRGQRKVQRAYRVFSVGRREDVLALLERHIDEVRRLRGQVSDLRAYTDELRELAAGAISGIGTVRYDAFEDMGGRLSFSTALVDERGDGVVLTAMNGRTDTRVYAKPLAGGRSPHNLSEEEQEAIDQALAHAHRGGSGGRPGGPTGPAGGERLEHARQPRSELGERHRSSSQSGLTIDQRPTSHADAS